MAAIPGYKEGCSNVGQTPYENLSCGVLSVVSTMANSLIATACIARYACTYINYGICTSTTDYLYCLLAYDMLHSHSMCHSYTISLVLQDHHARPCMLHSYMSIINAQISLVPRFLISCSFLLALPVIKRRMPLNLCIHSLFHH